MAWVRIDDTVPHHRKHLKAGPAASWLWVCCIAYAQRHLTDGFVPTEAVPMLGVVKGAERLMDALVSVGLMEATDGGFQVHDYHDLNDSKEEAIEKQQARHDAKVRAGRAGGIERAKRRKQTDEANSQAEEASGKQPASTPFKQNVAPSHPIPSHPVQTPKVSVSTATDFTPEFGERVRVFIEGYAALYTQHRNGARYYARPSLDYQTACDLCRTWPDVERLLKIAAVFLTSDDAWIANGTRSIQQFAARASWCDDKLREWEKARGVA